MAFSGGNLGAKTPAALLFGQSEIAENIRQTRQTPAPVAYENETNPAHLAGNWNKLEQYER